MSNYIEYKDSIAFHPGYYIKELVDESGLTQEEFAKCLDTTPKNLSKLINAQQDLSAEMALKLSRMFGTSIAYWQNLQDAYSAVRAEISSEDQLENEKTVLRNLHYKYFEENFGLPNLPRQVDEQVAQVRAFLGVASLTVLEERDLAVSFRGASGSMDTAHVARANAMVQIAVNEARKIDAPEFNKARFRTATQFALTQTENHAGFYPLVRDEFRKAGVVFVMLPNLPGSKVNGATRKLGKKVVLMVNDRRRYADTFSFTLLHEAGHVLAGDFGVTFEGEEYCHEDEADNFARDALVDPRSYEYFVSQHDFSESAVVSFAADIERDPGIVVGRLQNDGYVKQNSSLNSLKCEYAVTEI